MVRMPIVEGNITQNIFYSAMSFKNYSFNTMPRRLYKVKDLLRHMKKQGYKHATIFQEK